MVINRFERRQSPGDFESSCPWVSQFLAWSTIACKCAVINEANLGTIDCANCIRPFNSTLASETGQVAKLCGSNTSPSSARTSQPISTSSHASNTMVSSSRPTLSHISSICILPSSTPPAASSCIGSGTVGGIVRGGWIYPQWQVDWYFGGHERNTLRLDTQRRWSKLQGKTYSEWLTVRRLLFKRDS